MNIASLLIRSVKSFPARKVGSNGRRTSLVTERGGRFTPLRYKVVPEHL